MQGMLCSVNDQNLRTLALFSCCLVALGGSCHDNLRFRWAGQKTKEPSVVAFLDSRMTQWF